MRVAVIGAGRLGGGLARLLAGAGHTVAIANSRGPGSLAGLLVQLGPTASAHTTADAAALAEVVVLAVPWRRTRGLFEPDALAGRVLVDATNGFGTAASAALTSTERIAAAYPLASVVKALNTMRCEVLLAQAGRPRRLAHYVAGDDESAKRTVAALIESIGFDAVDAGDLHNGSLRMRPGGPVFDVLLTANDARQRMAAAIGRD